MSDFENVIFAIYAKYKILLLGMKNEDFEDEKIQEYVNRLNTFEEKMRCKLKLSIESLKQSKRKIEEKMRLKDIFDNVYDQDQLLDEFKVLSFRAPFCIVINKTSEIHGILLFQEAPRLYFDFITFEKMFKMSADNFTYIYNNSTEEEKKELELFMNKLYFRF